MSTDKASGHTPGPWALEIVENDSGRIKHLCPIDSGDGFSLLTVVEHDGVKFAAVYLDADARLIAAAPDMLAALKEVARVIESNPASICDTIWITGGRPETLYDLARAAIAKAEAQP